jgi:hypothetical protein
MRGEGGFGGDPPEGPPGLVRLYCLRAGTVRQSGGQGPVSGILWKIRRQSYFGQFGEGVRDRSVEGRPGPAQAHVAHLDQAARISVVTPAHSTVLLIRIRGQRRGAKAGDAGTGRGKGRGEWVLLSCPAFIQHRSTSLAIHRSTFILHSSCLSFVTRPSQGPISSHNAQKEMSPAVREREKVMN